MPPPSPNKTWEASLGILLLICAIAGATIDIPSFLVLNTKPIFLRIIWKHLIIIYFFLPKLLLDFKTHNFSFLQFLYKHYITYIWLSISLIFYQYFIYMCAMKSYIMHALLLGGLGSTFLIAWKIASKQAYGKIEYLGITANIIGIYFCYWETSGLQRIFLL